MTEKRNQRELLWFQTGGALNFITAAPHCGNHTVLCMEEHTCVSFFVIARFHVEMYTNAGEALTEVL
jgi:hypothetical protein